VFKRGVSPSCKIHPPLLLSREILEESLKETLPLFALVSNMGVFKRVVSPSFQNLPLTKGGGHRGWGYLINIKGVRLVSR